MRDWFRSLRSQGASLSDDERRLARRARNRMLTVVSILGVLALVAHAAQFSNNRKFLGVLGTSFVVAGTALFVGVALGFLFGIPRAVATPAGEREQGDSGPSYVTNTNLEQVSDWLTKILVGVGLVQIGEIGNAMTDLGDFLAPALGGSTSAAPFAVFTAGYFTVSGFLAGYLWTRIELRQAFESVEGIRERLNAVFKADAHALYLLERQLDVSGATEVPLAELTAAFSQVSDPVAQQIYAKAWQVRRDNWDWRSKPQGQREASRQRMERTIPIFRALLGSSAVPEYRVRGQLGFALKDQGEPDFAQAERQLTAAIEARGDEPDPGYRLYEFARAICRIEQDPKFRPTAKPPSDEAIREAVMEDLQAVVTNAPKYRDLIASVAPISDWATGNQLRLP